MQYLNIKMEVFLEDDLYVSLCPNLNVSSYGESVEEAKQALLEAVEAFLEECAEMGTLEDVLEECGYSKVNQTWQFREAVKEESLAVAI